MSYKMYKLRVVKAGKPYIKTNEDGNPYTVFPYLILGNNSEENIKQFLEDLKAKEREPKYDEKTGMLMYFGYEPLAPGSNLIIRTSKGKWIADMENMRKAESFARKFPGLNIGKHVADRLFENSAADTPMEEIVEEPADETDETNGQAGLGEVWNDGN